MNVSPLRSMLTLSQAVVLVAGIAGQARSAPIVTENDLSWLLVLEVDLNVGGPSNVSLHITPDAFQFVINGEDFVIPVDHSRDEIRLEVYGSDHTDSLTVTGSPAQLTTFGWLRFEAFGGNDTFENNSPYVAEVLGGDGDDTLIGGSAREYLYGQEGDDDLQGGSNHDRLVGGPGNDDLLGQNGHDELLGGEGLDYMDGGYGDDFLAHAYHDSDFGHRSQPDGFSDTMIGGPGCDEFVAQFYTVYDDGNPWTIDKYLIEEEDVFNLAACDTLTAVEVRSNYFFARSFEPSSAQELQGFGTFSVRQRTKTTTQVQSMSIR